jgi:hypothetical protein
LLFTAVILEPARVRIGFGTAQRLGLRLAATLRHRFGEIRKEDGEPEPRRDREIESHDRRVCGQVADEKDRRRRCPDLDDEHDRVTRLPPRIELLERIGERSRQNCAIEERERLRTPFQAALGKH